MNPLLSQLQPYPFERLRKLFADVTPNPALRPISLGIGEPKHATPQFIQDALAGDLATGLSGYPPTAGTPALRDIASEIEWRKVSMIDLETYARRDRPRARRGRPRCRFHLPLLRRAGEGAGAGDRREPSRPLDPRPAARPLRQGGARNLLRGARERELFRLRS